MGALDALLRDAIVLTAILCLPLLALISALGLVLAILQAATQVQEQTLTLLPKLIAAAVAVAAAGGFALRACGALFEEAVLALPQIVRGG